MNGPNLSSVAVLDSPFNNRSERFAAGRHGMLLFLLSVSMLFAASLIGYFVIRLQPYVREDAIGWPSDLPPLPDILLLSTLILGLSSAAMHGALVAAKRGWTRRLRYFMMATLALGIGFLAMQGVAWSNWLAALEGMLGESEPHRWALAAFYVLTGIHAAHVVGGLIPMLLVTCRAWLGRYSAAHHPGVYYCAMYWHFLGIVWLILYVALIIGR